MKTFIVILNIAVVALAAPLSSSDTTQLIKLDNIINPDGSYQYSYAVSNGISADERGYLKNTGAEEPTLQVEGQYQYPSEDGKPIVVTYTADENGFQPRGDHIPTPPPVPESVQRALAYIDSLPPSKI